MARRLSAVELQARADKAKAREAERRTELMANPKAYKPRAAENYSLVYYRDPLEPGLIISIKAKAESLTEIGGVSFAGLLATVQDNAVVVPKVAGDKRKIVTIQWYYGDSTPVVVPATKTRNRYVKFYDKKGDQSHRSLPFSVATGAFTLSTILTNFNTLFNPTDGTKKAMLGANGRVALKFGRETLASFKAG